ncbi:OmpA/MotB family protein [Alistipes indistinctus]|uniref:OmpA/MotB family protein n=1 Tax=Alistipes indistinctus TaxID=626932 RepID=UPI0015F2297C|nr:OmpA family protein [Alistipes indistinctus]BCG54129.1 flagellar motor protein MotB [Alistipes indistinctus]
MRKAALLLLLAGVACACVSNKKFNSMKAEALRLDGELNSANTRIDDLTRRNDTLTAKNLRLVSDSTRLYMSYTALQERYQKLLADGSAETARMLKELETSQMALNERSRRVNELEAMLRSREEAINAIRRKVTDALTGFDGKGLSISIKNGNVYVSMDDKLLFRSGSFEIDPNGARAVHDLATVLAQNPDINVMVEGHTDDVPYRPNGQLRDNLDLSAKRATTVVRLLLENKGIAPSRIIAAGRGESLPVASGKTSEARAKNRRTEIILTPKLDELMQLMQEQK